MNTTAKELALGGMFTALGVVLLCLGGVVPLALYACPILASAQELAGTAPALLWATCALGLALFFLYDLTLSRLTVLYRRRRR